jgi:undecaprenyl-diphosphatase
LTPAPERTSGVVAGATIFVIASVAYAVLGNAVSHAPPDRFDAAARGLAGHATKLAWIFTASCLWPALVTLGVIGLGAAARYRAWRGRIVFAVVTTVVSWQTSNLLKDVFARPRPSYWYVYHEPSFSYSSGHAMFATIVYGLWAVNIARSALPAAIRIPLTMILAAWGAAVIWSRLALGAQYPTDLIGGVLLGIAMLSLASLVARLVAPRAQVL